MWLQSRLPGGDEHGLWDMGDWAGLDLDPDKAGCPQSLSSYGLKWYIFRVSLFWERRSTMSPGHPLCPRSWHAPAEEEWAGNGIADGDKLRAIEGGHGHRVYKLSSMGVCLRVA